MKLTIHLHLVLRLRMNGVIPLLPRYAFMARTGKSLPFFRLIWNIYLLLVTIHKIALHFLMCTALLIDEGCDVCFFKFKKFLI
jgi:hypothetical protein